MNNSFFQIIPKKTFFLIIFLITLIGILGGISLLSPKDAPVPASPEPVIMQSPSAVNISSLQKTIPGKTTAQEIEQKISIRTKQSLENNKTSYTIESPLITRPDQIITQNNEVIFERVVLVKNQQEVTNISSITAKLGPPEKAFTGSKYYGHQIRTYIYASKGLAFIAATNDATNEMEIYEIQTFIPTSVENYMKEYGEDILLDRPAFQGE